MAQDSNVRISAHAAGILYNKMYCSYGTVSYIPSSCLGLLYMCTVFNNISTHFYLTRDAEETSDDRLYQLCHIQTSANSLLHG